MSNYNDRLDEIINAFGFFDGITDYTLKSNSAQELNRHRGEFKQAIISLIKELVAEAKPGTWVDPEDTDDLKWQGYVDGVEHFKQNLLKALDEK